MFTMNLLINVLQCFWLMWFYVYSLENLNTTTTNITLAVNKSAWHRKNLRPLIRRKPVNAFNNASYADSDVILGQPRDIATPCWTPNGEVGNCIEIYNCSILLNQLNNTDARRFIRDSECGPKDRIPRVCCGHTFNYKNITRTKPKNPLPKRCGYQNVTLKGRIMGGVAAQMGEFPWLVRLIHRNRNRLRSFGCSGFLIHSKFVMTAAHCLESEHIANIGPVYEVLLGEHNTRTDIDCDSDGECADPPQKIRVMENIVHIKYNKDSKQYHYDIGLVYLKKGAKMSEYIQPICLPERNLDPSEFWISGWGKSDTQDVSSLKMKVSVPKFDFNECVNKYNIHDIVVTKNQLCAGGVQGRDACFGDSGGPLMVLETSQWYAVGVVSYGLGCGQSGWPAIYTNIPGFIDWTKRQINHRLNAVPLNIKARSLT